MATYQIPLHEFTLLSLQHVLFTTVNEIAQINKNKKNQSIIYLEVLKDTVKRVEQLQHFKRHNYKKTKLNKDLTIKIPQETYIS